MDQLTFTRGHSGPVYATSGGFLWYSLSLHVLLLRQRPWTTLYHSARVIAFFARVI